jgi:hypothetical protein
MDVFALTDKNPDVRDAAPTPEEEQIAGEELRGVPGNGDSDPRLLRRGPGNPEIESGKQPLHQPAAVESEAGTNRAPAVSQADLFPSQMDEGVPSRQESARQRSKGLVLGMRPERAPEEGGCRQRGGGKECLHASRPK